MPDNKNVEINMNRRDFLSYSQKLLFGTAALSLCPLTLVAADIDKLQLQELNSNDALLLAGVCRLLFPHDGLSDKVYLQVVSDIEADITSAKVSKTLVGEAKKTFDRAAGGNWLNLNVSRQIETLRSLQNSELFRYLHTRTIESLYRNPEVWKLIGYQGSSIEFGGYLHRGFDDIDWLDKI